MAKELVNTVDDAFEAVCKTHQIYAQDSLNITPISFFIDAFKNFYNALLADLTAERFAESRRFFDDFAKRVDLLERNESLSEVWRLWEQGCRAVDRYDAREKARLTPPALSIDELIANGVSETVVAKIYGFYDSKGRPDLNAVRERRPWKPAEKKSTISRELQALIDAAKEKRREESERSGGDVDSLDKENTLPTPKTAARTSKQIEADVKAVIKTALDAEIEAGIAPRQIAAKHGCSVDDVKKRIEEINAVKKLDGKSNKTWKAEA